MGSFETIRTEQRDGCLELVLNRPDVLNALDGRMAQEMCDALDWASAQPTVRALILRGEGRAFSAGGDLKQMQDRLQAGGPVDFFEGPLGKIHEAVLSLLRLPKPVIGAVHGFAAGAGFNLALACDLLMCSTETKFHQAFVRIGAVPDCGGTWLLPRLVGRHRALELFFLGDAVDAERALALGIVNRVVALDALLPEARALGAKLATGPTAAYAEIKQLVLEGATMSFAQALDAEQQAQIRTGATEDFPEGVRSFFEKRAPRYHGR